LSDEKLGGNGSMDNICVECDAGRPGDPPVSVGETNGDRQTAAAAGHDVAYHGAPRAICGREGREFCFYLGASRERDNVTNSWEYFDWTIAVAGITDSPGI